MRFLLRFYWLPLIWLVACTESGSQQASQAPPAAPARTQAEIDEEVIQDWLTAQDLEAESTPSGIYYRIEAPGGEEKPTLRSVVTVHYRGTMLDGEQFDGTSGDPVSFPLARLIRGWQEGIPLVGRGGRIQLIIPSGLAYGPQGNPRIPPNSVLIFHIELVDFE